MVVPGRIRGTAAFDCARIVITSCQLAVPVSNRRTQSDHHDAFDVAKCAKAIVQER
jgi:hypothetical protein